MRIILGASKMGATVLWMLVGDGGWRMEDGMIYVQGVAAILSFQDLLTALVHVLSSVHLRLGVLLLSLYLVCLMIILSTNVLILF